jgi:serine-type D-Ala-D-Ala carboxypeptidase/endopeptidase
MLLRTQRPTNGAGEGSSAALGWFVRTRPDDVIVLKGGATGGYRAFVGFSRWSGKAAIVLVNAVAGEIADLGMHLVNAACRTRPRSWLIR